MIRQRDSDIFLFFIYFLRDVKGVVFHRIEGMSNINETRSIFIREKSQYPSANFYFIGKDPIDVSISIGSF